MPLSDPSAVSPFSPFSAFSTFCAVQALWQGAGLPPQALDRLHLTGAEPALPSTFAVGTALQAALAAAGLATSTLAPLRGRTAPAVSVDMADAVREAACRFTLDGRAAVLWDALSGLYRCADGFVRLHANFAHHRDGALRLLGLPTGAGTPRDAVERALAGWSAQAFEQAAADAGLVAAAVRTPEQWQAHAQAAAENPAPLTLRRLGDAPPLPPPGGTTSLPLAGVRVLDLTRILAGPVAGRTLAAYGADVLLVNAPHLPNVEAIAETSRGKRSALLDLRQPADMQRLRGLVRQADVFLQGYRPGALAGRGFSPEALAALRPGIVCLSLSAYGEAGPWAGRRGFDSLVQSATGFNVEEAQAFGSDTPKALPVQALDYGAGFLLAFGAQAALHRQWREGGSWAVQVSLAGVGHWLRSLGRVPGGTSGTWPSFDGEVMELVDSGWGRLQAVRHAVAFDGRRAGWVRPSVRPGTDAPVWLPR